MQLCMSPIQQLVHRPGPEPIRTIAWSDYYTIRLHLENGGALLVVYLSARSSTSAAWHSPHSLDRNGIELSKERRIVVTTQVRLHTRATTMLLRKRVDVGPLATSVGTYETCTADWSSPSKSIAPESKSDVESRPCAGRCRKQAATDCQEMLSCYVCRQLDRGKEKIPMTTMIWCGSTCEDILGRSLLDLHCCARWTSDI